MHFSTYLKRFQVSHVKDKNVDLHISKTQWIFVVIPFSKIIYWKFFLHILEDETKRENINLDSCGSGKMAAEKLSTAKIPVEINVLTCGGTSRTISSRIMVSQTKQLRYRKGFVVRTWVSEKSCLKNCWKGKKQFSWTRWGLFNIFDITLPVKFASCPHRARRERPLSVVLDAMMSLYPLIPPEWIAMRNDVQHSFYAWKFPYQFWPHISDSRCSFPQTWCYLNGWCVYDLWWWRFSSSFQLMAREEKSCHSTSFFASILGFLPLPSGEKIM